MAARDVRRIATVAVTGAVITAGAAAVTVAADGPAWLVYAAALLVCAIATMQILAPGSGLPPLRGWKRQQDEEPRFTPASSVPRVHR